MGAWGEEAAPQAATVAVLRDASPFSYQADDGTWRGLAVEMWQIVASELRLETRFEGMDRVGLLDAVATGRARFGVGALSITADRLPRVDFSVPIYATGVAIAVPRVRRGAWAILTDAVFSATFLHLTAVLFGLLALFGTVLWIIERHRNPDFAGRKIHGWGSGIWLSIVTMTTVGYGDKAPRTLAGRSVAALWMFISIALISIFTGTVATLLTVERMGSRIEGFDNLSRARVVSVSASAAAQLLEERRVRAQLLPDPDQALRAVLDGRADALVYDRALLSSALNQRPDLPIAILPGTLRLEYYAFAMGLDEPLRRQINQVIERTLDSPSWARLRFDYLGSEEEQH
jgi:ABC-type amino acid transport substrate-binding protein